MAENRYAILIACNEYNFAESSLPNLKFTGNDVNDVKEILSSKKYGNFSEIVSLMNKNSYDIFQDIELILNKATNEDLILIYFSGHGLIDVLGKLCLCTKNTKASTLISTSIPIKYIKTHIEASHVTKIIIILDCCYSGLACMEFGSLKGNLSGQIISLSKSRNRGIYVITSTTEFGSSFENQLTEHGEFTKCLLEGIKTWEAADKDGNITISSLYSYINKRMLRQRPMFHSSRAEGEIILASKDAFEKRHKQNEIYDDLSLCKENRKQNEIETTNEIDKPNVPEINKTISDEKIASEMKAFLKRMEYDAQCEDQELTHLLESECEIQEQIETEALERERESFLQQMDFATSNDIDETEEDSQETIANVISYDDRMDSEKRAFLKRMEFDAQCKDQELIHLLESECEIQEQIETEALERERESFLQQMDFATSNDIDETEEDSQETIANVISYDDRMDSEKRAFLKRMEFDAQCEDQELTHLLESECEIQEQIETEALERERESFLQQMDFATSNDIDETEEDSQETIAKVISYDDRRDSEKREFLKRMEYDAQCEDQELTHLLESECEIQDQIETEALERERESFLQQMDFAASNDIDETEEDNQETIAKVILYDDKMDSEKKAFLKRMEFDAQCEDQELTHLLESECEIQDQIEIEALEKERESFLQQMDFATSNDIDETEEDNQETIAKVISYDDKMDSEKKAFLKRMEYGAQCEDQELTHLLESECEIQDQIEIEALEKERESFLQQMDFATLNDIDEIKEDSQETIAKVISYDVLRLYL